MRMRWKYLIPLALALATVLVARVGGQAPSVAIDPDDIGGVVTSANGAEAGVWVIAETTDLPTQFRKIVVTDDQGRFVVPDLPKANYRVWVRGYGLVDSQPVSSAPGRTLALTAIVARDARTAAQIFPADYWYSLLSVPDAASFPLAPQAPRGVATPPIGRSAATGPQPVQTQLEWVATVKGCMNCHQMGNKPIREVPKNLGTFDSGFAAWDHRLRVGQNSNSGINGAIRLGHQRSVSLWADWTDRIEAGEVPPMPPRPQGVERNVVISTWDFGSQTAFMHDATASDKNNPTVNAYGPIYGAEWSHNSLEVIDPKTFVKRSLKIPMIDERDRATLRSQAANQMTIEAPSPYWGEERIWEELMRAHVPYFDSKGNVWFNATNKAGPNPAFCRDGATNKFARNFPFPNAGTGINYYDPKTSQFHHVETCFNTHHIQIAGDKDETLYASGGNVIAWVKTRQFIETKDSAASQGWCPAVLDYNGDGKTGPYTREPEAIDPTRDRMINAGGYGVAWNPKDGSVWYASTGPLPGKLVRIDPGSNPPETCMTEVYEPPFNKAATGPGIGATPRGVDADTNGIIWTALATTGHMASFDRSKCAVKNGPTATGQHCPEGWTLYPIPSPNFKNVEGRAPADFLYYNWVDRHNTFGLGANLPIATGTNSDSLLVLQPETKQWVRLRVPYPLGFYTRGLDGRIDDPNAGWKGRGLWAANETRVSWHNEGGKGSTSYAAQFQIRPNPLAK